MTSLLNNQRPPVFCPGCSHERVVQALDEALQSLRLSGDKVVIVTDIGCSGLFDTFFNTHALHGLHGRALTYATGLKLARPELTVIVIMGDGGLGIGGAHVLSSCRRNLDITLLVLNNFNYGMTGGQYSATTPAAAQTSSGFLNQLEAPLDICRVGAAAGAPWLSRSVAADRSLHERIREAICYPGFALMDIWGICPGRFSKKNRTTIKQLAEDLARLPACQGPVPENERDEFGACYRARAAELVMPQPPAQITPVCSAPHAGRCTILLLGAAGQRINTAAEILCLAAMTAGLQVSQKNDYPITVLRGHSVSEVVLDRTAIGFTGIDKPDVVIALAPEGSKRRSQSLTLLDKGSLLLAEKSLELPRGRARTVECDFRAAGLASGSWALAALAMLAADGTFLSAEMLEAGLAHRFCGTQLEEARAVVRRFLPA